MRRTRRCAPAGALLCASPAGWAARAAQAVPSTFGPVIGSALLCRSHLDNRTSTSYLTSAFGPSYKHEGGAFWFKAEAPPCGARR